MKYLKTWLALGVGVLIGFFGVFVSVFSDSPTSERMLTVLVILLIYLALGFIWGYWQPRYSGWWGVMLGLPGAIGLVLYMLKEPNFLYIVYALLIIGLASFGSYSASRLSHFPK